MTNDVADYYRTEAPKKLAEIRSGASRALNKILVRKEPEVEVTPIPTEPQVDTPPHTGHDNKPKVETGTRGTDTGQQVETPKHTGHGEREQQTAEDFVLKPRKSQLIFL